MICAVEMKEAANRQTLVNIFFILLFICFNHLVNRFKKVIWLSALHLPKQGLIFFFLSKYFQAHFYYCDYIVLKSKRILFIRKSSIIFLNRVVRKLKAFIENGIWNIYCSLILQHDPLDFTLSKKFYRCVIFDTNFLYHTTHL